MLHLPGLERSHALSLSSQAGGAGFTGFAASALLVSDADCILHIARMEELGGILAVT